MHIFDDNDLARGRGPRGAHRLGWGHRRGHFAGGRDGGRRGLGEPGEGRPDGPGRRGRRGRFDADSLRLILLSLIAEAPRHGYDLIREIERRSGGVYAPSPGLVYPTLTLLADMALALEQPEQNGRRLYAITEAGRAHLQERAQAVAAAMAQLEALASLGSRTNGAPIRRAMESLSTALRHRLGQDGATEDTMHDVAAIIDEATQKIERLK